MQSLGSFIFYRIIGGIGIGLASMLSLLYIAEIEPAKIRGKLVSWNQFAIVIGMLVVYFVNWFIAWRGDYQLNMSTGRRWMFLSGTILSLIFIILLFFIPQTPRYLVIKNKHKQAMDILRKTVGDSEGEMVMMNINETLTEKSVQFTDLNISEPGFIIMVLKYNMSFTFISETWYLIKFANLKCIFQLF